MREKKGQSLIESFENFVVIDIETTGLSPIYDYIIEIGAIRYENDIEVERFSSLVKPPLCDDGSYIDDYIVELTGITNEMLSTAPTIKEVLADFDSFIGNSILIGHNVNFDINFLYDNFEEYLNKTLSNDFVDTMRLSRNLHITESHHRLLDLCKRYQLDYSSSHRSISDCELTYMCYKCLLSEINGTFGSFDAFIEQRKKYSHGVHAKDIQSDNTDFDVTHPLYEKVCVFTGALEKMPRKNAMQIVADLGGINGDNVTKKTNFLILGNNDYCKSIKDGKSSKQKKAEKLKLSGQDIEIIPESVFYDLIESK